MKSFVPNSQPIVLSSEKVDSCVILLHGLTTNGRAFLPIARYLAAKLPDTRFVLPTAPVRPVKWAGQATFAWYDLLDDDFTAAEDSQGIQAASAYVHDLINEQIQSGLSADKIVLGGFSQGCAISFWAGLHFPQKLGGIFGLSGYLPLADLWQPEKVNQETPVLWQHGGRDELVTLSQIEHGKQLLAKQQDFEFLAYSGLGHQIVVEELDAVARWLGRCGL
ncbi:phospholipase [Neisseria chenwenguii]|nr:phospholipase [Neisseria chenwenguii]